MGKRELLVILCFVIVGAVVYQVTAPAARPDGGGFSLSRLIESARREVRGNRATAELTTTTTHALTKELTELRVMGLLADLDIVGETRDDVETTLYVHSNGYDEAEASQYTKESKLLTDRAASALILRLEFPRGGRQRGTLKVKVPLRLRIRIEPGGGRLTITNVAELEIAGGRGEATIRKIAGRAEVSHRGGPVLIEDAGSIEFTGRGGSITLTGVRGDASIKMDQGGEVTASRLGGALDMDCRNTEITLEDLEPTRGPIRVNAVGGTVTMKGLKSDTRIDGRNSEISVVMSAAAPVAIYNEGEDVVLTPPPGGFNLDALVIEGEITPPDVLSQLGLSVSRGEPNKESRLSGKIRGGGPTLTVRTTRGDLRLRGREPEKPGK